MHIPLSEQLRPSCLSEIAGQEHLIGKEGYITRIIQSKKPVSLLLFGPPGCGKTTIARLYAKSFGLPFVILSAVLNSTSELKKILKEGEENPLFKRQTLLFVDEIHRFNRAQQDIFLPFLEDGTLVLIGATTENPAFSLTNALISRLRVLSLNTLNHDSLSQILKRFEELVQPLSLSDEARSYLISQSQGDGRHLLNLIENLQQCPPESGELSAVISTLQKRLPLYDKKGEGHYNLISALHKSIRGSDPDAALYWLARLFEGGEDPAFIARRLIRVASEDVGLADPQAISIALQGWNAYHMLGSPEGELALAQVTIYLALSPKSTACYNAYKKSREVAAKTGNIPPPKHIMNAPHSLMKEMGYGAGYIYDPDTPHSFSAQNYFPEEVEEKLFYSPVERGFEREMKKRLDYFNSLRTRLATNPAHPL